MHRLPDTEDYLAAIHGHPQVFAPGERFAYCNSGYVVLALIAERASGASFRRLVAERVCGPAGMPDTAFLRSDERGVAAGPAPRGAADSGVLIGWRFVPSRQRDRRSRTVSGREAGEIADLVS